MLVKFNSETLLGCNLKVLHALKRNCKMLLTLLPLLPNGLTLLQMNPDCAARLDPEARDHGWLYVKGADGQWVTHRKLADAEIEEAYDQAADMAVKHGTQVRAG